jgi:tellurite resistance protein TehA-like permease
MRRMMFPIPPDFLEFLTAIFISSVSAFISISRRLLNGHAYSVLWVISEFFTAILCGYLMYNSYLSIHTMLPDWITLPVAVAISAHSGGRIFQEIEAIFISQVKVWKASRTK